MATKIRRSFTDEFKREAVSLLTSSGRPLTQMARELGIQPSMLRHWRDDQQTNGTVHALEARQVLCRVRDPVILRIYIHGHGMAFAAPRSIVDRITPVSCRYVWRLWSSYAGQAGRSVGSNLHNTRAPSTSCGHVPRRAAATDAQ